jgi:hypothetical protein
VVCIPLLSQNETTTSVATPIELREFDDNKLAEYRADDDYNYEAYKEVETGAFQRFINRILNWFNKLMSSGRTGQMINYALYFLGFLALVFFVVKMFGIESNSMFKKGQRHSQSFEVSEEILDQMDFEEAIRKAEKNSQWRVAVRLIYLFALKNLADQELIIVKKGKTNHEYLYEIEEDGFRQNFSNLSFMFDYTWYGHFEADKELVDSAKSHLSAIQKKELTA